MRRENRESLQPVSPFGIRAVYAETTKASLENTNHSNIHEECEIYINLSGDVSFIIENKIYPVKPGDIIISRPFEYHHCVYHSEKLHKHFCIWFDPKGNKQFLDIFYKRNPGERNLLTLPPTNSEAFSELLESLTFPESSELQKYINFFTLLKYLENAEATSENYGKYPSDVIFTVDYINKNFSTVSSVEEIAKCANVSVNTLERHFKATLDISPSEYLKKQRLANAAKLLVEGRSVTEASELSGFFNYSWFIALFKKHYRITPYKYKKELKK